MPGVRVPVPKKEDMMSEVGFLSDGSVVLVVGEAPARATSNDGGRTTTEVPQVLVARLAVEEVEADAVLNERPTFDPETATWVQAGDQPNTNPAQPTTPSGATDAPVVAARGEAQTADQLQAEIDRLQVEKAALSGGAETPAGSTVPPGEQPTAEPPSAGNPPTSA